LKGILFAFYQLTRLPLPAVPFDEVACGRSIAFFPAVGFFLGSILAALEWTAGWFYPTQVRAALLVAGMVVLTGGIHLDGFIDSIDGLFSGRPRERKLEIMRDSRVGAFGVIGIICLLLLKYSLFQGLTDQALTRLLPVIPALSRWGMSLAIVAFPYARQEGLGKFYVAYAGNKELVVATIMAAAAAALLGPPGIWLMTTAGAVTLLAGWKIKKELCGLTGDTYGFINEFLEVVLLLAAYPILKTEII